MTPEAKQNTRALMDHAGRVETDRLDAAADILIDTLEPDITEAEAWSRIRAVLPYRSGLRLSRTGRGGWTLTEPVSLDGDNCDIEVVESGRTLRELTVKLAGNPNHEPWWRRTP